MSRLLLDTCVLLDLHHADFSIFEKLAETGTTCFVESLCDELWSIEEDSITFDFIELIDATQEEVDQAKLKEGERRLSFYDWLLFVVSMRGTFDIVLTNDKRLTNQLHDHGIYVRGGLYPLIILVQANQITRAEALAIAKRIQQRNKRHITDEIISRFKDILNTI